MNKKKRVLLLQLPFPFFNHSVCEISSTIPIAAGYLKSMAYKMGMLDEFDIEILDFVYNEFCGDAMLIDTIVSKNPAVIGFSIYIWNMKRSLYIIKQIKSKLPDLITIIGGPEITQERSFIDMPGVDISVYGEGEDAFVQILKYLSSGRPDIKEIGNVCFKNNGNVVINPPSETMVDLNEIPSPYLLNFIDPSIYKRMWIETMRWCAYKCKYCSYPIRSFRKKPFYSPERIKDEIILAKRKGVKLIDLHDSAFNLSPNFDKFCDVIEEVNSDKSLKFKVFLQAELITHKTIERLLKCNILYTEVGLQSINPLSLKYIGRPGNLKKFIHGVKLLRKAEINILVDIIIGLPGDTLKTISETIEFLIKNKLDHCSAYSILSIGPSTELYKDKERLKLRVQVNPPYYVLETCTMNFQDIRKVVKLCDEKIIANLPPRNTLWHPYSSAWFPFLYTYSTGKYPCIEKDTKFRRIRKQKIYNTPITKIIVDINQHKQCINEVKNIAYSLKNRLANVTTLWFRCLNLHNNIGRIKIFLEILSENNPYINWNILLETKDCYYLDSITKIEKSIFYHTNHWDYLNVFSNDNLTDGESKRQATKIIFLVPFSPNLENKNLSANLIYKTKIVYSILIKMNEYRDAFIEDVYKLNCAGFLIDFNPDMAPKYILNILELMQSRQVKEKRKIIRFKNRLLQVLWDTKYDDSSVCTAGNVDLIVEYDSNLKKRIIDFTEGKNKFDRIEWDFSCNSRANLA